MWRYLAGAVAGVLAMAAGWLLYDGNARTEPVLPARPAQVATGPGAAQGDGPVPATLPEASQRTREQKRFDRYDKDRDGTVTRAEYLASRRKAFARLDRDGNGQLSFDEWAVKTTDRFAAADRDRSNTLTAAEFATTAPKRRARPSCVCPQTPAQVED